MLRETDPRNLIGRRACDSDGTRLGTVDEVYLDDATGEPRWAALRTGFFTRDALVPLDTASFSDGTLHVPFPRSLVRRAPGYGLARHLSPDQEQALCRHYGVAVHARREAPATKPGTRPPERFFGHIAGYGD